MRFLFFCFSLFFVSFLHAQKVESPDDFLGYSLGDKFTPHHKVVSYFEKMASVAKERMRLEYYGQTYEGRDLMFAIVSSKENMNRLEEIRLNNMRMAGILKDKSPDMKLPAVVWLSYNVHGNEASSTEVSMKLLHQLLAGSDTMLERCLSNVVVIIDPCLNPDGRDRYVNWFTQSVGVKPNPNASAREHSEPWPGGRTNHYNFDLNRDWAWQTQIESKGRIEKYNEWLPQIHCDFHEQYPSNPYYFAPAAEPMHEVITTWQRNFQTTIGKNHAKYFDANGWLYFTREVFDLFYPSYGDTYPMFNGSIGMTYEQAGHSRGGLAIAVGDDTLTLSDRVNHHYTTSISTIEAAANNHNDLLQEYAQYFDKSIKNGNGEYATYIISSKANSEKLQELMLLLDANRITYQRANEAKSLRGFHYSSRMISSFQLNPGDILISAYQTKGALVKVLFEPDSRLSDSVTYDITAWALPYVYGVDAYAVKEKIAPNSNANPILSQRYTLQSIDAYGYVIPYRSFSGAKLLAALLMQGIKVRYSEKDMKVDGMLFKKGSLIVLKNENSAEIKNLFNTVGKFGKEFGVEMYAIQTGFVESGLDFGSEKVHVIKTPSVGLVTGNKTSAGAAGEIWHLFEQQLHYPITLINSEELSNADLRKLDVLIFPEGDYRLLKDKDAYLKNWVRQGGKLIALESAVTQLAEGDWGVKMKKEAENGENKEAGYKDLKRFEDRERQGVSYYLPGAIYHVLLDDSHPLAFGYDNHYYTLKQTSNVMEFMKDGWNVGAIKQLDLVAGFVGSNVTEKIKDGTVISAQDYGAGQVICFTDDPVFRSFWQNGKLMLCNAVFMVGAR
jgi:hypothetical protein